MTKLPETISKFVTVFGGEVVDGSNQTKSYVMGGRRAGRTTASLIRGIGYATESADGAVVIDHHTSTLRQAEHNAQLARKLIAMMELDGYTVSVISLSNLAGLYPIMVGNRQELNQYCVHIKFNPIKEVFYDLRK